MNFKIKIAGLFAALSLVVAGSASAMSTAELVNMLVSMGLISADQVAVVNAAIGGTTTVPAGSCEVLKASADMTLESMGADVTRLQEWLISKGYSIPAGATGYFGAQTQSALAAYQTAMGITPAAGYFGPVTKASIVCAPVVVDPTTPTTPTTPVTGLEGGAGSAEYSAVSRYSNEEVGEGERDVEVAGLEVEAEGSDLQVVALRLDFTPDAGNGSTRFDRYAEEVSIWFDGTRVARVSSDRFTRSNDYTRTISLDNPVVIKEGDVGSFIVAIDAVRNLDTNYVDDEWSVEFDTIRWSDAQGALIVEDTITDSFTFTFVNFVTAANTELRISTGDNTINDTRPIKVSDTSNTRGVSIFSFILESRGSSSITIEDLPITITTGTADVEDVISSATLFIDGKSVRSVVTTNNAFTNGNSTIAEVVFEDIDYRLRAGDRVEVVVEVDIRRANQAGGYTASIETIQGSVNLVGNTKFYAEDEQRNEITDTEITGTRTGGAHTLDITVADISNVTSSVTATSTTAGFIDFRFTIFADDEDVTILPGDLSSTNASVGTAVGVATISAPALTRVSGDTNGNGAGFDIEAGNTATIRARYSVTDMGNGWAEVQLETVLGQKIEVRSDTLVPLN